MRRSGTWRASAQDALNPTLGFLGDLEDPALFNAMSRDLSETVPTGEFIANLTVVDRRVVATSGLIIHPHPRFGAPEFVAADRSGMPGLQISVQRSEHLVAIRRPLTLNTARSTSRSVVVYVVRLPPKLLRRPTRMSLNR